MFHTLLRKRTVPGKVWLQAFAEIYMRISDARVIVQFDSERLCYTLFEFDVAPG